MMCFYTTTLFTILVLVVSDLMFCLVIELFFDELNHFQQNKKESCFPHSMRINLNLIEHHALISFLV